MINTQAQPQKRVWLNSSILWLGLVQAITAVGVWAAASGGQIFRAFALGSVTITMLSALIVSFEAGLAAMIIFEPFRGFLRRVQYLIVPYSTTEPIHLITPLITFFAFALLLTRHKFEIFRATPLAAATSILAAICFLQVFNPLQGGLFIGLSGAMFFLVPMAWFYFGQSANAEFMPKMLRLIVVLSMIASLYGIYQLIFGYPQFEQYWIDNTDLYTSIAVYNVQRALATFNNSEEWGRYIQIGCTIAVGLGMSYSEGSKRVLWFAGAAFLFVMLAFTGQRTSIFGLFLSVSILFMTGAKNFRGAAIRLMLLCAPLLLIVALSKPMSEDAGFALDESDRVGTMLTHTTKGTVNPTGEGSLQARFETWTRVITEEIPSHPAGSGLGATTLAASRDKSSDGIAIDNHFISLALSAGVPTALLLVWIMFRALFFCYRGWRDSEPQSEQADLWRIMLALMATFILNNFFGTTFTIYSVAPIGWLIIGWISLNRARMQNPSPAQEI